MTTQAGRGGRACTRLSFLKTRRPEPVQISINAQQLPLGGARTDPRKTFRLYSRFEFVSACERISSRSAAASTSWMPAHGRHLWSEVPVQPDAVCVSLRSFSAPPGSAAVPGLPPRSPGRRAIQVVDGPGLTLSYKCPPPARVSKQHLGRAGAAFQSGRDKPWELRCKRQPQRPQPPSESWRQSVPVVGPAVRTIIRFGALPVIPKLDVGTSSFPTPPLGISGTT